jgi:glycolate oxidase iron-sulfur subunit
MDGLTKKQECASAFDAHHAPSKAIIEQCVHCGFCLPVCPTYVLWGQEMDSPRGRIYLMKMASEGTAEMNATWVSHFDSCLGCMACMTACPSGVDYGKLIEATRAQIERKTERPSGEKRHRRFMFENCHCWSIRKRDCKRWPADWDC